MIYRRIVLALAVAFFGSVVLTWFVQDELADREAHMILSRALKDVESEVESRVNAKLVSAAMAVRDSLEELPDTSVATLSELAHRLRVDDVCLIDSNGIMTASVRENEIGLDFNAHEQTREFLCLLDRETEFVQPFRVSAAGETRKYVGVWRPEGGFVQVGCLMPSLQRLARSSLTGLTSYRHAAGEGRIVITTPEGQIISDSAEYGLEGSILKESADDEFYVLSRTYNGFRIYGYLPRSFAYARRNWLVGLTSILLLICLCAAGGLVGIAVAREVRRRMKAHMEAEMKMATAIQTSQIPNLFPAYPDELRLDIHAQMDTAKEVGGDFYDFYHVGPDRFAVVIADVSGKGVPAAMFMMKAKAILKSCLTAGQELQDIIQDVNQRLSENNAANMFVTCWVGVVNLVTGQLEYVNCGHNPPYIRRASGTLERLSRVSGPPLGVFETAKYRKMENKLARSELLFLYTDGVTEAIDGAKNMFGEARLEAILAEDSRPSSFCARVKSGVDEFADGVEQFDDITTLAFRFRGEPKRETGTFPATMRGLADAASFVEKSLRDVDCDPSTAAKLQIVVDEIGSNIVNYSGSETMDIVFEKADYPRVIRLTFVDGGTRWNPLEHHDPDVTLGAADRAIGGLGILMVKKMMDGVRYEWKNNRNILMLRKSLPVETER